uniref:At1g61320/AtMIF1 LRR domain-containing protein n=1 Tax=Oryza meridionalis TaxID=40149 RepID=A0A0E0E8Q7_9ORYZ
MGKLLERRPRHTRTRNGSINSVAKRKGSLCQQEIWCHIYSLMAFKDAARAACVSRAFHRSWQCHPNLIFCIGILGSDFINKFGRIVKNHSGIGIKSVNFEYDSSYNTRRGTSISHHFDSWLHIAITPWIEKLSLRLSHYSYNVEYNLPCTILSDGRASSMRHLYLGSCSFHPTINLDLRSLMKLHLFNVHITGDELGCLLFSCYALEWLELEHCDEIVCMKVPCQLQRLNHLKVFECRMLQVIENKAPNICSFDFGGQHVQLLLGESSQMKTLSLQYYCNAVYYARVESIPNVPNLETLTICSYHEVPKDSMEDDLIFGDSSNMRQMQEYRHDNLQSVVITCFCSAKSLIELTCCILDCTTSLEYLTLDTTRGVYSCSTGKHSQCFPMDKAMIPKANRAMLAIETYIVRKVPSTVKLNVVKPCPRCHIIESSL